MPALVVTVFGLERTLHAGRSYSVGRDPQADIVIPDARVSWRHAVIRSDQGGWILEDAGSSNGTFLEGHRIDRTMIGGDCVVRLGHPEDGTAVGCAIARSSTTVHPDATAIAAGLSVDYRPSAVRRTPVEVIRIGRSDDNDIVLSDLGASRHHAELRTIGGGSYLVVDLGSHNGTFVNGERVTRTTVTEQDIITIGNATFRIVGHELRAFIDDGGMALVANSLTVRLRDGKTLLNHATFPIGERFLVGIIGPSGAGKSTLLGALTGLEPATDGSVLYDSRDLYANYAELRHRIGLVPQENVLHPQLTVRRALEYAAELRFPPDTSAAERSGRVEEVLEELDMTAHQQTRTGALSGGQQKRVNVAIELLTKPSVLFLDEPTSGLDPGLDKAVMQLMRRLAEEGRTVVLVTHSVTNLDACDRLLVLVAGGRVAFFGPPAEGLNYFGKSDWADVFQAFSAMPERDWAAQFEQSPQHRSYVADGLITATPPVKHRLAPVSPPPRARMAQFSTLCRRYAAVLGSDRGLLGVLIGAPIVLGLLTLATPSKYGLAGRPGTNTDVESLLLIVIICTCFAGAMNSVRELIKERAIYVRERAAGLSPGAYLASKIAVLGAISAMQAILLLVIGFAGRKLPAHGSALSAAPFVEFILAVAVLAVASMVLGLLISALVTTPERAMPLLMVAVVVQVLFSGGIFSLSGKAGLEQLAWLAPSRWGFALVASTANLTRIAPSTPGAARDALWLHNASTWGGDMGALVGLTVVLALLTWWRLVRLGSSSRR
jgi:ABC transport system ATP-binding/permease protein